MEKESARLRTKRGRGRPKVAPDEAVARRIVQEAYAVLCTEGYARMNMGEVAARCCVSKKTLYRLFPSKLALFRAVTEAHRGAMISVTPDLDELPLVEALLRLFRMDLDEKTDEARRAFMRVVMMEAMQMPELRRVVEESGRDHSFELVAAWLERQRTLGQIEVDDIQDLTKTIIDIAFGAILHAAPAAWTRLADRGLYLRRAFALLARGIVPPDQIRGPLA